MVDWALGMESQCLLSLHVTIHGRLGIGDGESVFTFTLCDHSWLTGHWGWRVSVCLALLFVADCVLMLTSVACVLLKGGHA